MRCTEEAKLETIMTTKARTIAPVAALAALIALGATSTLGPSAANAEEQAPAAAGAAAPAAQPAAPAAETAQPVEAPAATEAAPVEPTAEAAPGGAPASVVVTTKDLAIGTPVFSAEGEKIGEVNRITANASGQISEIQVTYGTPAGLSAKAFAVAADKIVGLKDGVKLSLSSDQAKSLPPVGDNG